MVIGFSTLRRAAAAAAAALYGSRAGAVPSESQPVEILFGPHDLRRLLLPASAPDAPREAPRDPAPLASSQVLKRLRELALGASLDAGPPAPEHAAVTAAAIAATEDTKTLRELTPRRPSLLPQLIRAA